MTFDAYAIRPQYRYENKYLRSLSLAAYFIDINISSDNFAFVNFRKFLSILYIISFFPKN